MIVSNMSIPAVSCTAWDPYADALWRTENDVPINADFAQATVFITAPRRSNDGTAYLKPIGTGFMVDVLDWRHKRFPPIRFRYLVTARHVINQDRDRTHVQIRTGKWGDHQIRPSGTENVPTTDQWYFHPEDDVGADVAVTPFTVSGKPKKEDHAWILASITFPLDEKPRIITPKRLGDPVYFVGLLGHVQAMIDRALPMVRSGTLGAWDQDGVEVEIAPRTRLKVRAHLIDCYSHSGFSGSPCFIQWVDWTEQIPGTDQIIQRRSTNWHHDNVPDNFHNILLG